MSDSIRNWLKTVLYLDILLGICGILLENSRFEKYMRYFTGFIMLACLLSPLIEFAGIQRYLDASWFRSSFSQELEGLKSNDMADARNVLKKEYQEMLEKQIMNLGHSCGISVKKVKTKIDETGKEIEKLDILVEERENEETDQEKKTDMNQFRNTLAGMYKIDDEKIIISETWGK